MQTSLLKLKIKSSMILHYSFQTSLSVISHNEPSCISGHLIYPLISLLISFPMSLYMKGFLPIIYGPPSLSSSLKFTSPTYSDHPYLFLLYALLGLYVNHCDSNLHSKQWHFVCSMYSDLEQLSLPGFYFPHL